MNPSIGLRPKASAKAAMRRAKGEDPQATSPLLIIIAREICLVDVVGFRLLTRQIKERV